MFREKVYKGTKTGYASATVSVTNYGIKYSVNAFFIDFFCEKLLDFLKECKVDCSYDSDTKVFKINKIPIMFYFGVYGSKVVYVCWFRPFYTTAIGTLPSTVTTVNMASFLYDTTSGDYEIRFRILGEPTTFFVLIMKSFLQAKKASSSSSLTYTILTNGIATYNLYFGKAKNLLNQKNVSLLNTTVSSGFWAYEFDSDGEPIETLRNTSSSLTFNAAWTPNDDEKNELSGSLPLIPLYPSSSGSNSSPCYLCEGIYLFVFGIGIPSGAAFTVENQTFTTINGETFWVLGGNYGIVKIIS